MEYLFLFFLLCAGILFFLKFKKTQKDEYEDHRLPNPPNSPPPLLEKNKKDEREGHRLPNPPNSPPPPNL